MLLGTVKYIFPYPADVTSPCFRSTKKQNIGIQSGTEIQNFPCVCVCVYIYRYYEASKASICINVTMGCKGPPPLSLQVGLGLLAMPLTRVTYLLRSLKCTPLRWKHTNVMLATSARQTARLQKNLIYPYEELFVYTCVQLQPSVYPRLSNFCILISTKKKKDKNHTMQNA